MHLYLMVSYPISVYSANSPIILHTWKSRSFKGIRKQKNIFLKKNPRNETDKNINKLTPLIFLLIKK
jgi:hypothetical protein